MKPHPRRHAYAFTVALSAALTALAAGCGDGDALVGGDCAQGYTPCGDQCCPVTDGSFGDATAHDGASDAPGLSDGFGADRYAPGPDAAKDGEVPDGTTDGTAPMEAGPPEAGQPEAGPTEASSDAPVDAPETGPLCMAPLFDCSGSCVDLTSDPLNCSQCGEICVSQLCVNSICTGSTTGGIVFIGHDYLTTLQNTAQARVLSNAVFIPQNNPLHVLSYERYASPVAIAHVQTILTGVATQLGRGLSITATSTDTDIPADLGDTSQYQVLLVHDQVSAATGAMAALGTSWASTLTNFTQLGGIVVMLDGGTGVGEMGQLASSTTLLTVSGQSAVASGTPLDDVAPGDVVGVGVVSPYGAGKNSVSLTTEANGGNVVYVIDVPSDAGTPSPVVIHKLF